MDYEIAYKRLLRAITDGGRLRAIHFEAWSKGVERDKGYKGSELQCLLERVSKRLRRIAATEGQLLEHDPQW